MPIPDGSNATTSNDRDFEAQMQLFLQAGVPAGALPINMPRSNQEAPASPCSDDAKPKSLAERLADRDATLAALKAAAADPDNPMPEMFAFQIGMLEQQDLRKLYNPDGSIIRVPFSEEQYQANLQALREAGIPEFALPTRASMEAPVSSCFGGAPPHSPAERLAEQTKMLADLEAMAAAAAADGDDALFAAVTAIIEVTELVGVAPQEYGSGQDFGGY